ncbi:MAG: hypothetical protein FD143_3296 [Ignavibacteria bacterium]|nr:MAG: hypothetical protein FD143_3296 [Ignavibacteria bacterium]
MPKYPVVFMNIFRALLEISMTDQNSSSADGAEAFSSALNTQSSSPTYHTAASHPTQSDIDLSQYYTPMVRHTQQNFAHTYPPADFDTIPSHSTLNNPSSSVLQSPTLRAILHTLSTQSPSTQSPHLHSTIAFHNRSTTHQKPLGPTPHSSM